MSSSFRHASKCEGECTAESKIEKLPAKIRIRESFCGFRSVDSNATRLLTVGVPLEAPSNVILRSFEQVPRSMQKDDDALQQIVFSFERHH